MIPKDTIDKIFEAARVEEVVGDFITLKKRGANLLGLCPFHGEKTPSFTVSPAKGIYKCFGCGKAGNSVNFIMEHESLTYPEALKYLAKKYNIPIVEKEITPEEQAVQNERESLFIVSSYAQKYFSDNLWDSDEGKSVGLGYFRERGFTDETIKKFQLGYSFEERTAFSKAAIHAGYKADYLVKTGISILSDKYKPEDGEIKLQNLFDRYSGRVMFPIHSVTGRVIGFGGRILGNDKKFAKYVNSPQSDIYDKSKVLYGLYFAKKQIVHEDNCYLVEGYTDVISMHQSGVENVVSSSGTSLTVEQIRLIHRFTNNITILYDGDVAGIKASFRGIDLILEEGMNVKVLLFPDGDDPDSYSKKVTTEQLKEFIKKNAVDFIKFKTNLLFEEAKNEPVKKASLIREIIESIAIVPDAITRNEYITQCSNILQVDEQTLVFQVKSVRDKGKAKKTQEAEKASAAEEANQQPQQKNNSQATNQEVKDDLQKLLDAELNPFAEQEKNLVRLLLNYGNKLIEVQHTNEENELVSLDISIAEYVLQELIHDELSFIDPVYQMFLYEFLLQMKEEKLPTANYFTNHNNPNISTTAISLISSDHVLSDKWKARHNIYIGHETDNLKKTVDHDLYAYKERRLQKLLREEMEKLKTVTSEEEAQGLMISIQKLNAQKTIANKLLGRTIV